MKLDACGQQTWNRCGSRSLYVILGPCTLTVVLCVVIFTYWRYATHSDLTTENWQNTLAELKIRLSLVQTLQALIILLTVHALQLILCFPFLHLTKTMYGYFFGIWPGLVIALVWESGLLVIFTFVFMHCSQSPQNPHFLSNLIGYVKKQRKVKYFHVRLVVLHMSSMPMVTKTALVAFSAVSAVEFVVSGFVSTLITSINDTCLGGVIAHANPSTDQIALYSFFLCFNAILPTTLSVFVIAAISGFTGDEAPRANVDNRSGNEEDRDDVVLSVEMADDKDSAADTPRTEARSVDTQPGDFEGPHQEPLSIIDPEISTAPDLTHLDRQQQATFDTGDLEICTDPGSTHFEWRLPDTFATTPPCPPPRREKGIASARASVPVR